MPKLTEQQRNFARLYVKNGFDQSAAAIQAGYSPKHASSQASHLLNKPQIKAEIDRLCEQIEEKTTVEVAEILQALRKIAFASQSKRVTNSERLKALELLGRYKSIFSDRLAIGVDKVEPIEMTPEQEADYKLSAKLITSASSKGMSLNEYLATYPDKLPRLSSSG